MLSLRRYGSQEQKDQPKNQSKHGDVNIRLIDWFSNFNKKISKTWFLFVQNICKPAKDTL